MGRDGAEGAATELGAAVSILGVKQIGPALAAHFRPRT
jgi:hypothetical protein